jgi:hypothetical protein
LIVEEFKPGFEFAEFVEDGFDEAGHLLWGLSYPEEIAKGAKGRRNHAKKKAGCGEGCGFLWELENWCIVV